MDKGDPVAKRPGFLFTNNKMNVMFLNLFKSKVSKVNALFVGHYIDPRIFYTVQFNKVPCINFIGEIDTNKAFDFIANTGRSQVQGIYQHSYFGHDKKQFFFNNTLFVLKNKKMIGLANNYCQVFHTKDQYDWGQTMIKELSVFHITGDVTKAIGFTRNTTMN